MLSKGSFLRSLAVQSRVVRALLLRELITRFGRENIGVLWLIAEPMIFTLAVSALWTIAGLRQVSDLPIVAFAVTGYSSVLMWRNTVGHCTNALEENFNLLFHRNVQPIDVFIARIVLEIAGATASFAVLTIVLVAAEFIVTPPDLFMVTMGWLMLAWFSASLALFVGAATSYSSLVTRAWSPISYILFPLSGAAYMVDWLSPQMRELALLLPMVHGLEMVREGYFGSVVRTHYDVGYMAMCNLALTYAGLLLQRDAGLRVGSR